VPLPAPGTKWPPPARATINETINRQAQRWSFSYVRGDWGRAIGGPELDNATQYRRLPVVADIASTAADLLLGEEAQYTLEDEGAQDRMDKLLEQGGLHNKFLEAAETASALGGVYLRPVWDPGFQEEPILTVVQPQWAVPEWRWGKLNAVTFWRKLEEEEPKGVTIWHLERHEEGRIMHGLYRGSPGQLGDRISLDAHPDTKGLPVDIVLPAGVRLIVEYIPNVLPNRLFPNGGDGRPDTQGAEDLLDDIDVVYSSWMRDIRLGKGRVIVDSAYLRQDEQGAAFFDVNQEVYEAMRRSPEDRGIDVVQFDIRVQEHMDSLLHLFERTIDHAGYSPGTFGMRIEGRAESGTALRVREGKTYHTTARKGRYFIPAQQRVVQNMLQLTSNRDGTRLAISQAVDIPIISLADPSVNDPTEISQTVVAINTAKAASLRTLVKMAQPVTGLHDNEIDGEVEEINSEKEEEIERAVKSSVAVAEAKGTGPAGGRVGGSTAARAGGSRQPGQGPRG
jgi:hypothetical protein